MSVNVSDSGQHYIIFLVSLQCLCILNTPPYLQFWTIQLISTYSMWLCVGVLCVFSECVTTCECGALGILSSECEIPLIVCLNVYLQWLSYILFVCFFLIRPVVLLQLGVVLGVGVFHGDASRQDGGHVVSNRLSLGLLLLLLLNLLQLDACRIICRVVMQWRVSQGFLRYKFISLKSSKKLLCLITGGVKVNHVVMM